MKKHTMRGLPPRQKAQFIWDYYRWQIFIAIVLMCVVVSTACRILTEKEPLLDVVMINSSRMASEEKPFEDFFRDQGYEYFDGAVELNNRIWMYGDQEIALAGAQMLMCAVAAGNTDIFFWDGTELCPTLADDVLMDLSKILPPESLEKIQNRLVYTTNTETGKIFPCGVNLSGTAWLESTDYYEDCCAGVAYSAENRNLMRDFIAYLLKRGD